MAAGYAADPVMARCYPYVVHAQVLADHPAFAWEAVVDPSETALELARERWQIPFVARSVEALVEVYQPEVAVIATPPESRLGIIEHLPALRAVLVEKPLGLNVAAGQAFLEQCHQRGLPVQVNLWRRADETFRALAAGQLNDLVGRPQAVFGLYGNGLLNNGTHVVDLVRMLFGEIELAQAIGGIAPSPAGPIPGDVNMPFCLRVGGNLVVTMQPINFVHYREVSLDIWGEQGRMFIMQGGLRIFLFPRCEHRAIQNAQEIASDQPKTLASTVGHAVYHIYDNLAAHIHDGALLWSSGRSALQTAKVVEAVLNSAQSNNAPIELH